MILSRRVWIGRSSQVVLFNRDFTRSYRRIASRVCLHEESLSWQPGLLKLRWRREGRFTPDLIQVPSVLFNDMGWCFKLRCPNQRSVDCQEYSQKTEKGCRRDNEVLENRRRNLNIGHTIWDWLSNCTQADDTGHHWHERTFSIDADSSEDKDTKHEASSDSEVKGRVLLKGVLGCLCCFDSFLWFLDLCLIESVENAVRFGGRRCGRTKLLGLISDGGDDDKVEGKKSGQDENHHPHGPNLGGTSVVHAVTIEPLLVEWVVWSWLPVVGGKEFHDIGSRYRDQMQ